VSRCCSSAGQARIGAHCADGWELSLSTLAQLSRSLIPLLPSLAHYPTPIASYCHPCLAMAQTKKSVLSKKKAAATTPAEPAATTAAAASIDAEPVAAPASPKSAPAKRGRKTTVTTTSSPKSSPKPAKIVVSPASKKKASLSSKFAKIQAASNNAQPSMTTRSRARAQYKDSHIVTRRKEEVLDRSSSLVWNQ